MLLYYKGLFIYSLNLVRVINIRIVFFFKLRELILYKIWRCRKICICRGSVFFIIFINRK